MTDSIKNKIAALLAKAEGTTNEFEAAAFMSKVNELLEKHQMDLHEIRQHGADRDPMGMTNGEVNLYASMGWARDVGAALARYYGCRFVFRRKGNHFTYDVIGRESARVTLELMFPFIISQVRVYAKALIAAGRTKAVAEREVGHALTIRISRMAHVAQAHRDDLASRALIPVDESEAFMRGLYGASLVQGKAKALKFSVMAVDAAEKVSLNHQATGRHQKMLEA